MGLPEPPTLAEITELTRSSLHLSQDDEIHHCGRPALSLLQSQPDMCLQLAYQKLHDVPYKDVKPCWRRLYTDAALWRMIALLESRDVNAERGGNRKDHCDWVTEVVRLLDMTLILTGAPAREELVELVFSALHAVLTGEKDDENESSENRPLKRQKLDNDEPSRAEELSLPHRFPSTIATPPQLEFPLPRLRNISFEAFQSRISNLETQSPFIIEGAIDYWPALSERPWADPSYLLSNTLDGRRLVPIEIGRSYTDEGWSQKILSFGEFMSKYMFDESRSSPTVINGIDSRTSQSASANDNATSPNDSLPNLSSQTVQRGYLAQHDLFAQIPSLRADISIPDYCYCDPPSSVPANVKPVPKLDTPLLNAWFGPADTVSPLHTDPYHNILAQVVGSKYIRLYAPSQTPRLHPRDADENGVDMSNTSSVDLDEAMAVFPELSPWRSTAEFGMREKGVEFEERFPGFKNAVYVEGVLGPGDCLYIPVGWWHYVRSLTPSFSVSFWFN